MNWPCPGKVEGIYKAEGCCSSGTTRSQVTQKVAPELCLFVNTTQENLLVLVLEGEIESLRGEVPNHVGEVTTPVTEESLLFGDADKAVNHTCELHTKY